MGQSFFHFKAFSIQQQSAGLKVTTDACLLGAIATHPNPLKCLDIGTGTGVLSLMMAQKFLETKVTAIEIEKNVAAQAASNISNSDFHARIQLIEDDFISHDFNETFDLVLCNPPYFKDHLRGEKKEKNTAIHNSSMPVGLLAHKIFQLLNPAGACWLIYPRHEMELFKTEATQNHLHLHREITVFNRPGKYFRTICCFSKVQTGQVKEENLDLHHADGSRTDTFSQLMHDFYLENTEIYKRN